MVLDTNVLVAALRSRLGSAHRLLQLVGTGAFEHVVSVASVLEYEDILKRPGAVPGLRATDVDAVLDYLCLTGWHQAIYFLWRPALPDPGDDLVLEVAAAAGCDSIVTFNTRDFRGAERFGIRPITPRQFLTSLEGRS